MKKIYVSKKAKKKLRGGVLIASNHTSPTDPLMLGATFWYRRMFFLAAEIVMDKPLIGTLLKGVGCIAITRDICDMEAIRKSIDTLKEGHMLSVFPQGKIDAEDNVGTIKSGIVLMALRANVPIVPVYISKRKNLFKRNTIVIGEPIIPPSSNAFPSMTDIELISKTLSEKMSECKSVYMKRSGKNGNN